SATQCTVTCGGGTEYYVESYKDAYLDATCPDVTVNTGESCNTQACCSIEDWEYYSCTSKGYEKYKRWNGCTEEYEYETRKETSCKSSYTNCEWTDCEDGWTYKYCDYYKGGTKYSNKLVDYDTCEEPPEETDSIDKEDSVSPLGNIGTRYDSDCNSYYITTCDGNSDTSTCNYTQKNGASQSGTIRRGNLKTALPSSCTKSEDPTKYCDAYIYSVSSGTVKFTVTSGCSVESYSTGACTKAGNGTGWIKAGYSSVSYGSGCGIYVKISGVYKWGDTAYKSISWNTYKCSSSSKRGTGYYCTGSKHDKACTLENTACVG
ncbi:MAG: hypothetical protein IJO63_00440, partial [Bacilli bacterium]|nr:hypothetical protein [Bacilli bacterium]